MNSNEKLDPSGLSDLPSDLILGSARSDNEECSVQLKSKTLPETIMLLSDIDSHNEDKERVLANLTHYIERRRLGW